MALADFGVMALADFGVMALADGYRRLTSTFYVDAMARVVESKTLGSIEHTKRTADFSKLSDEDLA